MNIQEAVKKAAEEDAVICKENELLRPDDTIRYIKPTNSYDACLLIIRSGEEISSRYSCWNPTANDLLANDWTVTNLMDEFCYKVGKT